jgi:hypothetical protein
MCFAKNSGGEPAREDPGIRKPRAPAHLIWVAEGFGELVAMCGQQLRMTLGNVALALCRQLDIMSEIGAREAGHPRVISGDH